MERHKEWRRHRTREYSSRSHHRHNYEDKHYSDSRTKPREESRHRDADAGCSEPITAQCDPAFNWEKHRRSLNKMFFGDRDIIKRGTPQYDSFWPFLKKYQAMQSRRTLPNMDPSMNKGAGGDIPSEYHPWHKINFCLSLPSTEELMAKAFIFRDELEEARQIPKERVEEFKYILHLYMDFLHKQKFARLKKLRKAQRSLPIYNFKEAIIESVKKHQVVLVAGDTGCGKSTQVPQYLMESGFNHIACTQPRRIACISLCKRVAYETLNEGRTEIGYQIRFEKCRTKHTKILFLTEGLLLRQVATDPMLSDYEVLILDEVHERHLPCDFLLGIVKCLTHQRPDLKVVLMSATINIELFAEYFNDCPVIQVPGRLFPIQVHYQPVPVAEKGARSARIDPGPYVRILQQIDKNYPAEERGDVLVFLSGMTEISTVAEAANQYAALNQRWVVLQLHSSLGLAEQDKVFDRPPEGVRKCIFSTNIAETSVTIDGVRFVVDSGKVKEMSYDSTCHMQRLKEFWISRASAEQRKGRAGRTGPGICYRLYGEPEYCELEPYSTPEIRRVPLHSLLLQMISMGLPDARKFPFLEPPDPTAVEEAIQGLKEEGALTEEEVLTPVGQMLSRLPVDVTLGKMLILGSVFNLLEPMLTLAATLSVQSPLTQRAYRDPEAISARKSLESSHGDPFTLLAAYNHWLELKTDPAANSRKWCHRRGLEEQRFYEITKLRRQFKSLLQDAHLVEVAGEATAATSSAERSQRHGELKQLRELKRAIRQADSSQRKKVLKMDSAFTLGSEGEEEEATDIRDVEFRMANNHQEVKELRRANQSLDHQQLALLKLILCSGLYPQLALADEHNGLKSNSEQLFHTRGKPYVCLHPNGVFALRPDILHLGAADIQHVPGFMSRQPASRKHQLLAYMTLLETTKPYLTNTVRVPAAHTCVLLARFLDSNLDFTRLVCDGWLELRFPVADDAQKFMSLAMDIRDTWQKLLDQTLKECMEIQMGEPQEWSPEVSATRRQLSRKILEFLHTEILHTVRRLLAADIKDLYVGPSEPVTEEGDQQQQQPQHPVKGGVQLRDYLVYNCLVDADQGRLLKSWTCPHCQQELHLTVLDRVRHQAACHSSKTAAEDSATESSKKSSSAANKKSYYCLDCQEELLFSPTEILRHKAAHSKVKAVAPPQ